MVSGERTTLAHGVFSGTAVPAASPKGVPSRYAIVAAPSASHQLALGVIKPLKALFREARMLLGSTAYGRCCSMAKRYRPAGRRHRRRPRRHRRLAANAETRLAREVMRSPRRSGSADLSGIERRIASDIRRTRR